MTPTAPAAAAPARALPASLNGRPVLGLFRHDVETPGLTEGWTVLLGPGREGGDHVVASWTPADPDGWIQGAYFHHSADAAVEFARRLRALGPEAEAVREGDVRPVLAIIREDDGRLRLVSDDPELLDDQRLLFIDHGWVSSDGGRPLKGVTPMEVELAGHDLDALHERAAEAAMGTLVVEEADAP